MLWPTSRVGTRRGKSSLRYLDRFARESNSDVIPVADSALDRFFELFQHAIQDVGVLTDTRSRFFCQPEIFEQSGRRKARRGIAIQKLLPFAAGSLERTHEQVDGQRTIDAGAFRDAQQLAERIGDDAQNRITAQLQETARRRRVRERNGRAHRAEQVAGALERLRRTARKYRKAARTRAIDAADDGTGEKIDASRRGSRCQRFVHRRRKRRRLDDELTLSS